jgi:hypothetical protein
VHVAVEALDAQTTLRPPQNLSLEKAGTIFFRTLESGQHAIDWFASEALLAFMPLRPLFGTCNTGKKIVKMVQEHSSFQARETVQKPRDRSTYLSPHISLDPNILEDHCRSKAHTSSSCSGS